MLQYENVLPLSDHFKLYDLLIPKTNLLRQLNELVDFSFVYDELRSKYSEDTGRSAISPIRMFKYLLLKTIYEVSDVDVVERSRYDLSFKYFLGMLPEDDVIESSSLTKFRKLRLKDMNLLDMLVGKTIEIALSRGIKFSKTIIVDATHTMSRSNPQQPLEILRKRSSELRKSIYAFDEGMKKSFPQKYYGQNLAEEISYTRNLLEVAKGCQYAEIPAVSEKLNLLQETCDDIMDHCTTSDDKDARSGHKSSTKKFFGYKSHIAMSDNRMVTGVVVTSGEKADGNYLQDVIRKTEDAGIYVDTVVADAAYSGKNNIERCDAEGVQLVAKLNPVVYAADEDKDDGFVYNKDAGTMQCPAGHLAISSRTDKARGGMNARLVFFFSHLICRKCPLRDGCLKKGTRRKSRSIRILDDTHENYMKFEKSAFFAEKYRLRYMIEAKNAELKNVYGYSRALSYGLESMEMQGAMCVFASNLKRILTLLGVKTTK